MSFLSIINKKPKRINIRIFLKIALKIRTLSWKLHVMIVLVFKSFCENIPGKLPSCSRWSGGTSCDKIFDHNNSRYFQLTLCNTK